MNIDPDGTDWYKSDDGYYLWQSGSAASVTITSKVDVDGNAIATKTYTRVGGDDMRIGTSGANVIGLSPLADGEKAIFKRDVVSLQKSSSELAVIVMGKKDDSGEQVIPGLIAVSKSFGSVKDVALRDHSDWRVGIDGLLVGDRSSHARSKDGFGALARNVKNGKIKLNNTSFYFLGCNQASTSKSFTEITGITSYGADDYAAPYNAQGVYHSGGNFYKNTAGKKKKNGRYSVTVKKLKSKIQVF